MTYLEAILADFAQFLRLTGQHLGTLNNTLKMKEYSAINRDTFRRSGVGRQLLLRGNPYFLNKPNFNLQAIRALVFKQKKCNEGQYSNRGIPLSLVQHEDCVLGNT